MLRSQSAGLTALRRSLLALQHGRGLSTTTSTTTRLLRGARRRPPLGTASHPIQRGLSTSGTSGSTSTAATTPPQTAAAGEAAAGAAAPAASGGHKPGFFSRNFGKIMLGALATLIAYLYRSSENKKRSKALKVFLEDRRAVEPWEIDELRMANADALPDRAAFQELLRALQEAFPQGTAPYREFIQVVSRTLAARGQRLQLTHYLDRAILFLNPDGGDVDLLTLLCALSLTLNVPLEERIAALHDVAAALGGGGRGGDGDGEGEAVEGRAGSVVDLTALQRLVAGLVATAQVPAEALVVADKGKAAYPFQSYRVATVEELAERAVKELAEAAAKAKPPEPPLEIGPQGLSPEELTRVLATKAICAWGECYRGR